MSADKELSSRKKHSARRKLILQPGSVVATIAALCTRIEERFGECGLSGVCGHLLEVAKVDMGRAARIGRPYVGLRMLNLVTLAAAAAALWSLVPLFNLSAAATDVYAVAQGIEATANLMLLAAAAVIFLIRLERRLKRRGALGALHELRSIVHVIDMHQLTKDPSKFLVGANTPSSPPLELNEFEMTRYLDYCSEMVSLTSKVAVVFGQTLDDQVVNDVVSDIERISAGLSQKIWQKVIILQQLRERAADAAPHPAI